MNLARLCVFAIFAPLRERILTQRRKGAHNTSGNYIFNANILPPTGFFALFLLKFN